MKILITTPSYPPENSGLGNAVFEQVKCLVSAGHLVTVATGGVRNSCEMHGAIIESFSLSGADCWLNSICGETEAYLNFLRGSKWDVVLLNGWQNWASDLVLNYLNEIPGRKLLYSHGISTNIFFLHDPLRSLLRYLAWRPYWWRLPRYIRSLDGLIFLASSGDDVRFADLHVAKSLHSKFRIVPNTLSHEALSYLDIDPKPLMLRDRLMAVGSYQWQKGFDFVIRAFAASHARNHFSLHLYGQQYTPYVSTLCDLIRELGLTESEVVFHYGLSGEALLTEYLSARLFLSGSHTECQPLVLLDANATGVPFIARESGCIAYMPGGVGIRSWQEMASQIDLLVGDSLIWQALVDDGKRAAREIYHPDLNGPRLLEALSD